MKIALHISIFLLVLFVLPLLPNADLIISWPVLFCGFIVALLLATQPLMSSKESTENKTTDNGTMWLILLVSATGLISSILEWAYLEYAPQRLDLVTITGIGLMVFGISFRIWAIRTLDKAFSATVQIKKDQQLITSGPYKWFRHPSYTGAWTLMVGTSLLFHSYAGLIIMGPGMLWVYSKRIATEEKTLQNAFGKAYSEMKFRTWMILPGW